MSEAGAAGAGAKPEAPPSGKKGAAGIQSDDRDQRAEQPAASKTDKKTDSTDSTDGKQLPVSICQKEQCTSRSFTLQCCGAAACFCMIKQWVEGNRCPVCNVVRQVPSPS
jgi:hypothetical protein